MANVSFAAPVGCHLRRFVEDLAPLAAGIPQGSGDLDAERIVDKREGMICFVSDDGDRAVIWFPGGNLRGPARIRSALQFIAAARTPFRSANCPARLGTEAKCVLVARLLRDGLLLFPEI